MNTIEKFREDRGVRHYGVTYLSRENAIKFLELCVDNNVQIWGFDGFHLLPDGGIRIDQCYSPDYSYLSKEEAYKAATEFFENHHEEDMGYEFVYAKS